MTNQHSVFCEVKFEMKNPSYHCCCLQYMSNVDSVCVESGTFFRALLSGAWFRCKCQRHWMFYANGVVSMLSSFHSALPYFLWYEMFPTVN